MPRERLSISVKRLAVQTRPSNTARCRHRLFTSLGPPFTPLCKRKLGDGISTSWIRGAKRQATLPAKELPQGLLPLGPAEDEPENAQSYPTVMQQARNNMRKFEHCVVLTRVGNFYELYFEQAEIYGPLLNIKVAHKQTRLGPVPMAGFPFFQLDRYLKILVQDHQKYVAVSEEIINDASQRLKSGGLLCDRQVKRVVTPGTLIDENFLSPYEHNYLLAIHVQDNIGNIRHSDSDKHLDTISRDIHAPGKKSIGLAWLDLSSGGFFTQSIEPSSLASAIARICPKEIVIDKNLQLTSNRRFVELLVEEGHAITYYSPEETVLSISDWTPMLEDKVSIKAAEQFTREEIVAVSFLLQYAGAQLRGLKMQLQSPIRRTADEYMGIDKHSLRGLEITETLRDGLYKGSLLHAVRRTSTESGARLLQDRLTSPSFSIEVINDRLDLVEEVLVDFQLRENIVSLLRQTSDTLRLVQKFSFGRGDADDLLSLSRTIDITSHLAVLLRQYNSRQITKAKGEAPSGSPCITRILDRFRLDGPTKIATAIRSAIDEDGLSKRQRINDIEAAEVAGMARDIIDEEGPSEDLARLSKRLSAKRFTKINTDEDLALDEDEVWIMRRHASSTLDKLHQSLKSLREEKSNLMDTLRKQLAAPSLVLKWTPGLGHICHVKGKDTKAPFTNLEKARAVSSSKSTRSIQLPEWTRLGERIDEAKLRIRAEEQRVFQTLRNGILQNLVHIRRNAAVLDELDVACSFAMLASDGYFVRPILNHGNTHKIFGGRHPTVEAGLASSGRSFTTNNCFVGEGERIWLITGPNMAGKSTFLRQNALISILAQTGGFVPAEFAEIGLVDQIFSRVGSADNVSQDQSTFMVEMLETAHILRNATRRSFVIMDEVGRGTTPEDGIAVGYAALHHLHYTNQCRALFATHFHVLADMTKKFESIGCYCTNVVEHVSGSFAYIHRLRPGVNRDSHALKVARLAGMPETAIAVANHVIANLKPKIEAQDIDALSATG